MHTLNIASTLLLVMLWQGDGGAKHTGPTAALGAIGQRHDAWDAAYEAGTQGERLPAPRWMYEAFHVDAPADAMNATTRLPKFPRDNRFIGSYQGTFHDPGGWHSAALFSHGYDDAAWLRDTRDKDPIEFTITGWADTTRAFLSIVVPNKGSMVVMTDMGADVILISYEERGLRKTSIKRLIPNSVERTPANTLRRRTIPTGRNDTIAGRACSEELLIDPDTLRVWSANDLMSPFADLCETSTWLIGPAWRMRPLAATGANFPLRFEQKEYSIGFQKVCVGPCPLPVQGVSGLGEVINGLPLKVPPPPPLWPADQPEPIYEVAAVQEQPRFPGCDAARMSFISKNFKFPPELADSAPAGKIWVEFVVKADGSVADVIIKRGLQPTIDQEAVRVVRSMPTWTPGKLNGRAVPVRMTIPMNIRFR